MSFSGGALLYFKLQFRSENLNLSKLDADGGPDAERERLSWGFLSLTYQYLGMDRKKLVECRGSLLSKFQL